MIFNLCLRCAGRPGFYMTACPFDIAFISSYAAMNMRASLYHPECHFFDNALSLQNVCYSLGQSSMPSHACNSIQSIVYLTTEQYFSIQYDRNVSLRNTIVYQRLYDKFVIFFAKVFDAIEVMQYLATHNNTQK